MELGGADRCFSVALGILPHVALKHGAMKAGPSGSGVRGWGNGGWRGERGRRDSERKKGYYTFFIKFPGTKPHQSVS